MSSVSVAILAGGKSSRMGTNKALVQLAGKPLLQHVVERTAPLGQAQTMLITDEPALYQSFALPMYPDVRPDCGSLGGIFTALTHSQPPYTLVVACDMPFLNTDLLRHMIGLLDGTVDIVVPRVQGYPQGMHAIYHQRCLQPIAAQLDQERLKIIRFYDQMRVCYLGEADYAAFDPQGRSFANLNTPEELAAAREQT